MDTKILIVMVRSRQCGKDLCLHEISRRILVEDEPILQEPQRNRKGASKDPRDNDWRSQKRR